MSANLCPPADTLPKRAERLVISWIGQEDPAPHHLAALLNEYRILDVQVQHVSQAEEGPLLDRQNAIYDSLTAAALSKVVVSAQAEAQLRRIQRRAQERPLREMEAVVRDRDAGRISYTLACTRAIELYHRGVRV